MSLHCWVALGFVCFCPKAVYAAWHWCWAPYPSLTKQPWHIWLAEGSRPSWSLLAECGCPWGDTLLKEQTGRVVSHEWCFQTFLAFSDASLSLTVGCHQNVNIKAYEQISESWTRRKVLQWSGPPSECAYDIRLTLPGSAVRISFSSAAWWLGLESWSMASFLEWHVSFPREKTQVFRNVSDQCNSWGCFAFCEIMLSDNKVILSQPRFLCSINCNFREFQFPYICNTLMLCLSSRLTIVEHLETKLLQCEFALHSSSVLKGTGMKQASCPKLCMDSWYNGLEMLLSLSKVKIDVNIIWQANEE